MLLRRSAPVALILSFCCMSARNPVHGDDVIIDADFGACGMDDQVYVLVTVDAGSGLEVYAGGKFTCVGGSTQNNCVDCTPAQNIAR